MPGSELCPPGNIGRSLNSSDNYFFIKKEIHGCLFYGSPEMGAALIDLATEYVQKQQECMNSPDQQCEIPLGPDPSDSIIPISIHKVIPLGINSMSLPWGGLFDVNGNWKPPY
jgi:hypothetical protein